MVVIILWILLQTTFFQNLIIQNVTKRLSKDLNTTVSIEHVNFRLFNKMLLEGTLVLDHQKDTLLYAGAAKVNITDWFFFKENITLKYIGLEDAFIHLNRKDSVWNYQFLEDYFSSPSSGAKKDNGIDLKIQSVHLKNIIINQRDEWKGVNMLVSLGLLDLDADIVDTKNKKIIINSIELEKPVYSQYDYPGLRPKKPVVALSEQEEKEVKNPIPSLQWNPDNWSIVAKKITLKDAKIAIENESEKPSLPGYFDERQIILTKINGQLKNLQLKGDSLISNVSLSLEDRGGFKINKITTDYKFTPDLMEFKNLDIITPTSHLKDYFAMHYESFNDDMQDFIHKVKMEGRFIQSTISSKDLSYFAPELTDWNRTFLVTGRANGRVDNISGSDILITEGGKNYLEGDLSLRGLPEIDETFIDVRINKLRTHYTELASLIPEIKSVTNPQLSAFGNILFRGSLTGYVRDFVTFGTVSTNIGILKTDLHLKIPHVGRAQYQGKISTTNFQLGKLIGNKQLETIDFEGKVDGRGFSEKEVAIGIDGTIAKLRFNGYTYTNIIAHGDFEKNHFSGTASIHDENIKIDTLNGSINFSKSDPRVNLMADVQRLDLNKLGFTKDTISLSGIFNLDFEGSNIDNFLGSAKLSDAVLLANGKQLSFDSLNIHSTLFNNKKLLALETNELEATINGDFRIAELPEAFQLFLFKYYPAYINKPKDNQRNQDFTFLIKTKEINDYLKLFDKNIGGLNNSIIIGNINVGQNTLNLQADVPQFNYSNISFNNVHLSGIGTQDTLKLSGDIEDVVINDSLHSPGTKINIVAANDISDVTINATANKTLSAADLSARILTNKDGFKLTFNPSNFTVNQKNWYIQKDGEIELNDKFLMAHNLRLSQNGQEVLISTSPSEIGNSNDVIISMKNIVIEDLTPFFLQTPKLNGLLGGDVRINDPFNKLEVEFNTEINQFHFENDSIGVLTTTGTYRSKSGKLDVHVISNNDKYNFIGNFGYHPKDSLNQLTGSVAFKNTEIHVIEDYMSGIFESIYGTATGILNISGTTSDPKLTGSVTLNNTRLTVNYTKVTYTLENNSVIHFNPDEIDFGFIKIKDSLNNTATLTGKVYHNFFDDFFFNELHVKTDSRGNNPSRFILLNTTSQDNDQFYGHVIGRAELSINGFITDMRMNISGEPTDSSHIYLPIGETAESSSLDYIEFIQFGREMKVDLKARKDANIKVDMELTANPLAKIDVILDETTGDVIKAQGNGKLFISAGTKDPLTIRGRYSIEEGEYTFNFQTFLKTPFTLEKGYIEWQGDPYLANLNIDAVYTAENVILNNIPTTTGIANTRGDVDIIFKLRGTLKDPSPNFEFQFTFDNPLKSDPIANEYLKTRYQSDNNQLLNQVASLLLFNMFMNNDQGLITSTTTTNFVTKSVGQLLSTTLTSSLNSWLQKLLNTKSVNLYTNINTSDFNFQKGGSQREIQNVGNFGVKYAFLNNKLLVNVGGNLDYRMSQLVSQNNSNFLFTPDVSFEYLITPDGRFRVIGFNRSDTDPGDIAGITRRNRSGIQLSYRKSFDTFEEFFTNERRRK
ncbi:MAG: translocation/assembly module TamB domain-containing protein [Ginsengibacter sp.]